MNLIAERLNRGLTVPAFARAVGVPEHVIRHAEKGNMPSPPNALRIAEYLGVKVTDIWPLGEQDPSEATGPTTGAST